jgi:hypothetical protein
MGFNKRYVPELDVLMERRKRYDSDEEFLNSVVGKADALIGSVQSMEYLDSIYEKISSDGDKNNGSKHTGQL